MFRFNKSLLLTAAVIGASVAGLSSAQALSVQNVLENTGGLWTFEVTLAGGESIHSAQPSQFTIYDFDGYVPGSAVTPANWTFVGVTNSGPTYPATSPTDDPGLPNLTWAYTGSTVTGPTTITGFGADTTGGFVNGSGDFAGQTMTGGAYQGSVGALDTPSHISTAPEPGTLSLMGVGLAGIIGGGIRRRKNSRSN